MANSAVKLLLAFVAAALLAMAPGVLRTSSSTNHWVLVRVGARPVHDDQGAATAGLVKSVLDKGDGGFDAIVGMIVALLGFVVDEVVRETRGMRAGRADCLGGPPAESGLSSALVTRAPPRLLAYL